MNFIYELFGTPLGWIMWLCYKLIPVYGIALFLFTLITKAALVPLSIKQQKSMVRMQIFQPRMQEIQKKYANNKEKMNEEMMKLYQEENYNPMSGCLPMLIQFPILFGLYDVIQKPLTHILHLPADIITEAKTIAATVLNVPDAAMFMKDLSSQIKTVNAINMNPEAFAGLGDFVEKVNTLNLTIGPIDLTQQPQMNQFNVLWIIPILSLLSSLLLSIFTMRQTKSQTGDNAAAAGMTRSMMFLMPLMSGYFGFIFPAGVGIYWILSNLLTAAQTALLNKYMNPVKLAEKAKQEYEERREKQRQEKIEAKKLARESGQDIDKALSQKEINRIKLAEARKRDADKYGEQYDDVTDEDLK